jgi:hypothetical protein
MRPLAAIRFLRRCAHDAARTAPATAKPKTE